MTEKEETGDKLIFEPREPDQTFMDLKQYLQTHDEVGIHISWQYVYDLNYEDFAENPTYLQKITDGLLEIEQSADGQKQFQELILNEQRVRPVDINVVNKLPDAMPMAYLPLRDSISFHPMILDDDFRNQLTSTGSKQLEILDNLPMALTHEGEHAVRIYGKEMPDTPHEFELYVACEEEHAIARADLRRQEKGEELREVYWDIEHEIDTFKGAPEEFIKKAEEQGIPKERYDQMLSSFSLMSIRSKGCDTHITEAEAAQEGAALMERLLKETGLKVQEKVPDEIEAENRGELLAPSNIPKIKREIDLHDGGPG